MNIKKLGWSLNFFIFINFIYEIYKKIRMESQFFLDFIYEIYKKIRMESQFFLDFIYEIYKKIRMDVIYVTQRINKLIFW